MQGFPTPPAADAIQQDAYSTLNAAIPMACAKRNAWQQRPNTNNGLKGHCLPPAFNPPALSILVLLPYLPCSSRSCYSLFLPPALSTLQSNPRIYLPKHVYSTEHTTLPATCAKPDTRQQRPNENNMLEGHGSVHTWQRCPLAKIARVLAHTHSESCA